MLCSGMLKNQGSRIKGSTTSLNSLKLSLAKIWILLEQLPPRTHFTPAFPNTHSQEHSLNPHHLPAKQAPWHLPTWERADPVQASGASSES